MRLSEAIRLGAMLKPQAFGTWYDGEGTCATGAALEAMGFLDTNLLSAFPSRDEEEKVFSAYAASVAFREHNAILKNKKCACLECGSVAFVGAMIVHLNNKHRWTRERIADWVETIETAAETKIVAEAVTKP